MLTYTFYIEENATFSDGSRVRPEDVLASLITARTCQIYSGRFAKVTYIGLNDDGSISMEVNTYMTFPRTLLPAALRFTAECGKAFVRKFEAAKAQLG